MNKHSETGVYRGCPWEIFSKPRAPGAMGPTLAWKARTPAGQLGNFTTLTSTSDKAWRDAHDWVSANMTAAINKALSPPASTKEQP